MSTDAQPKQPLPQLAALILAGGQSSRMGQDKALIPIQGVPLLQRICAIAQQCTPRVYVVTPHPERYPFLLPSGCQVIREVPLPGEPFPHGPLVGFAQGLAQIRSQWVLLLACDLPRLRAEVLQTWIEELAITETAQALLPHHPKGWEPLCGFYRIDCLPDLQRFIQQGGRSFQPWLAQMPVKALPLLDASLLFNCNTPQDLSALQSDSPPPTDRLQP